ncbi:MAG: ureidoglycolate lyase [Chloroflexi bacterium]|nr:ureidoglycolate lyase [Chloroflexota bacterium]
MSRVLPLRTIDPESFAPYGDILALDRPDPERLERGQSEFRIITRSEDPTGWRLAILVVRNREISRLEHHPTTLESFEPVSGLAVLFVAPPENPEAVEAFVLDQPVCLRKGVWHDVLALTREATIKIAENLHVTSEYHPLPAPLRPLLGPSPSS